MLSLRHTKKLAKMKQTQTLIFILEDFEIIDSQYHVNLLFVGWVFFKDTVSHSVLLNSSI